MTRYRLLMDMLQFFQTAVSRLIAAKHFKQYRATEYLENWWENLGVLIISYQNFKGLEADVGIILTEFNSEATKED